MCAPDTWPTRAEHATLVYISIAVRFRPHLQLFFCSFFLFLEKATLNLREDGTLGDIEDTYLDPSAICVPVTTSDEDNSNMTISVKSAKPVSQLVSSAWANGKASNSDTSV